MAENGEQKLIAVARHIANTLGHTDTMTDDILKIFYNFDGRLREKLTEKLSDEDPPYHNFIVRLQNAPDFGKHADRHIKYGVEDIEARINELFQGSGSSR
ncbi:unnamed protein product [Fraxinus pennsylvanica]|uniref:Uncharacterized protein n=1 Tax=Fraxinus pennsylvanica TaxID=56036 RepID=A0AAD1Z9H0_9LAMI|nr:unnamed protein product [Fraxinus pennsylvanica]